VVETIQQQASEKTAEEMGNYLANVAEEVEQLKEWGANRRFVMKSFISQLTSDNALRWSDLSTDEQKDVEVRTMTLMADTDFVRAWVRFLKLGDPEPQIRRKFRLLTLVAGVQALQDIAKAAVAKDYETAKKFLVEDTKRPDEPPEKEENEQESPKSPIRPLKPVPESPASEPSP
jgi:hypothetical protein